MDDPKVSICIPTYCRYTLLRRALASVLAQDFGPMEVIVSDNASEDGSWEETSKLAALDPRVVVRRNEKNLGWTGNLNNCIKTARGKYLVFLCDDDALLPGMVSDTFKFMEEHPGAGLVHTAGYGIGFSGKRSLVSSSAARPAILKAGDQALSDTALSFDVLFSSVMVRAECFSSLGQFVESISSDYEMWSRISTKHDVGYINKPLVEVYAHSISPKMTPERYISESDKLRDLVMRFFPAETADSGEIKKKADLQMSNTLRSLGIQAMQIGSWSRGMDFFKAAEKYSPAYGSLRRLADIMRAIPRRILFAAYSSKVSKTHV